MKKTGDRCSVPYFPCKDGSHGCHKNAGGICYGLYDKDNKQKGQRGWTCACNPGYKVETHGSPNDYNGANSELKCIKYDNKTDSP